MATDRVVLFENISGASRGALQGVSGDDLLLAGGVKRGSGSVSIDGSGNISLTGPSVIVNAPLNMTNNAIHNLADPVTAQDAATKNYSDALDSLNIKADGSVPFTGDQSMGGNQLTSVGTPAAAGDAANKTYVDTLDAEDIKRNGSVAFTGDQSMGGNQLTNVGAPGAANDAATKTYVDTLDAEDIKRNGSVPFTADQSMGGFKLTSVATPTVATDAANKAYADSLVSTGVLKIASVVKTDGDFTSLDPLTGTTIAFTTTVAGPVSISASAYLSGLSFGPYSGTLGVTVDGVDYTLGSAAQNNGAGGDFTTNMGVAGSIAPVLAAGAHTVFIFISFSVIAFASSPGNPITLTVIYPG